MTTKCTIAAAVLALAAAAVQAQAEPTKVIDTQDAAAIQANTLSVGGSARVQGLINANGTIVRSKGIVSVTHSGVGQYCVYVSGTVHAAALIPTLSFNYNSSPGFNVFVVYSPSACSGNAIGVKTYETDSSQVHTFADEGFTIVAP